MPTESFVFVSAGDKSSDQVGTCLATHLHSVGHHITSNTRETDSS
jgi:DNA-binding CsgD family transcriptional regulator